MTNDSFMISVDRIRDRPLNMSALFLVIFDTQIPHVSNCKYFNTPSLNQNLPNFNNIVG